VASESPAGATRSSARARLDPADQVTRRPWLILGCRPLSNRPESPVWVASPVPATPLTEAIEAYMGTRPQFCPYGLCERDHALSTTEILER